MKQVFFFFFSFFCTSTILFSQSPEPANQPTNLKFTNVKPYNLTLFFTASTADGYLILKSDKPIIDAPLDGTVYEKGGGLGSCKVMSVSSSTIYSVREMLEGTKYYFKIFAFNGSGSGINYKQGNPLMDSITAPPANYGNYYSSVDSTAPTFVSDLHNLINLHTQCAYGNYKFSIIATIYERDTINGQAVVNCEYSNETTIYFPPFDFLTAGYSREHVICQSWMPTYPVAGSNLTNLPEGSDYYNLLLTLQGVNSSRGDGALGIVVTPTGTYNGYKRGLDSQGRTVFEPQDSRKGDAARCMMYEMVCYNGLSGSWALKDLLSFSYEQDQYVLKLWNLQDPPDKFERTKNEYISSLQNNRNPFIDHPAWANCINFDSLTKIASCIFSVSIEEELSITDFNVFPSPAMNMLNVEFSHNKPGAAEISIMDISGREIITETKKMNGGKNQFDFPVQDLQSGIYTLKFSLAEGTLFRKFMVMH